MGTPSILSDRQYDRITADALKKIDESDQTNPEDKRRDREALLRPLTLEADVIVTSVIAGFICTRFYQNQPCRFDFEHPTDAQYKEFQQLDQQPGEDASEARKKYNEFLQDQTEFSLVLDALSHVLARQDPMLGKWLDDGQSPPGREGELITGRRGGETATPEQRHAPLTWSQALMMVTARKNKDAIYQGRGAYTGVVENPLHPHQKLYPTMRVTPAPDTRSWPGIDGYHNWGLIDARDSYGNVINLMKDPKQGLGPLPEAAVDSNQQVGYIHGMCSALVAAAEEGPWCKPYEMATGTQTTKMASCFPCTTYLYASGYAPSSIHLGRGESWLPPQDSPRLELDGARQVPSTGCNRLLSQNLSRAWHRDIFNQMLIGCYALCDSLSILNSEHVLPLLDLKKKLDTRRRKVSDLKTSQEAYAKDEQERQEWIETRGGSLFLDALTVHDKEITRLKRILAPLVEARKTMEQMLIKP